ncbi:RecName [Carpediemonas membranifera]|uniref:RecName n=1 Tax=Carpediemonas membranifera TaxID=201153 RepID=A0A8J6E0M1_9EUKA|nr:RecName [Carpediemonas membranifera]|eukprot:KAG9392408.1 RecName [Carpediemonas membranifera]
MSTEDIDAVDFPKLCKECMGKGHVKAVKTEWGGNCCLCTRPFHSFRVKSAGSTWQTTDICHVCATVHNCCQVCLKDFDLGVSVVLRGQTATSSLGMNKIGRSTIARRYATAVERKKYKEILESKSTTAIQAQVVKMIEGAKPMVAAPVKQAEAVVEASGEKQMPADDTGPAVPVERARKVSRTDKGVTGRAKPKRKQLMAPP